MAPLWTLFRDPVVADAFRRADRRRDEPPAFDASPPPPLVPILPSDLALELA